MLLRAIKKSLFILSVSILFSLSSWADSCTKPWIFFDSGQTLVVTPPDYKNLHNVPGMEDYLRQLAEDGHSLALVINVPEDWGKEIPVEELLARRVLYTQQFFQEGWQEGAPIFPWNYFGKIEGRDSKRKFKGHVFFPTKDSDRKPALCPSCALNVAFQVAKDAGCPAIYQGEDADEMAAAEQLGFIPFQVGHTDSANFYLRQEKIGDYVKNYVPGQWKTGLR